MVSDFEMKYGAILLAYLISIACSTFTNSALLLGILGMNSFADGLLPKLKFWNKWGPLLPSLLLEKKRFLLIVAGIGAPFCALPFTPEDRSDPGSYPLGDG